MCRHFAPALVLSLLDPKLSWDEAEVQASIQQGVEVVKADGSPLSPYDLKRLQVHCLLRGHLLQQPCSYMEDPQKCDEWESCIGVA